MGGREFDQGFWEELWSKTLREHADKVARRPPNAHLFVCLYVHVAGSVEDMVRRMANGVAPGGTLFLVGHRPIDPSTGAATAAASQAQVSVEGAVAALDSKVWELVVAEEHPRAVAGTGVDAVIRARRRNSATRKGAGPG